MCDNCNVEVTDEVRNEIDALSDAAIQEITRIVADELSKHNEFMVASVMRKLGVDEVTLDRESASELKRQFDMGNLKFESGPVDNDENFKFAIVKGEGLPEGLAELAKLLGIV